MVASRVKCPLFGDFGKANFPPLPTQILETTSFLAPAAPKDFFLVWSFQIPCSLVRLISRKFQKVVDFPYGYGHFPSKYQKGGFCKKL